MPAISIIVPVYKVEPFLRRCVNSILAQTFSNIETILVDDGSPDDCGALCEEYATKDSRILVIHQPNGGVSAARNTGLDWAFACSNSEWLSFVDSDDWIHKDFLKLLVAAAEKENATIGMSGFICTNSYREDALLPNAKATLVTSGQALNPNDSGVEAYAWGKIYRKTLFEELRFPVGMLMEDFWLIPEIVLKAHRIVFVEAGLYCYYQNTNSILHNIKFNVYRDAWRGYEKQIILFSNFGLDRLKKMQINRYVQNICAGINHLTAHRKEYDFLKEMRLAKQNGRQVLKKYHEFLDYSDENVSYAVSCLEAKYKYRQKVKRYLNQFHKADVLLIPFDLIKRLYYRFVFPSVKQLYNSVYTTIKRRNCKNKDFSIISSNCIGGFIYHRLGMQFLSPTINCFINPKDFVRFCNNIPYYLSLDLRFISTDKDYPVAELDDIRVFFNHSKTQEDAAQSWNKRRQRVRYDNLYIIAYDQYAKDEERLTKQEILMLKDVPCNNLVVLSEHEYPDIPYVKTIVKEGTGLAELYFDQDKYGVQTFERKFDYINFLRVNR